MSQSTLTLTDYLFENNQAPDDDGGAIQEYFYHKF